MIPVFQNFAYAVESMVHFRIFLDFLEYLIPVVALKFMINKVFLWANVTRDGHILL